MRNLNLSILLVLGLSACASEADLYEEEDFTKADELGGGAYGLGFPGLGSTVGLQIDCGMLGCDPQDFWLQDIGNIADAEEAGVNLSGFQVLTTVTQSDGTTSSHPSVVAFDRLVDSGRLQFRPPEEINIPCATATFEWSLDALNPDLSSLSDAWDSLKKAKNVADGYFFAELEIPLFGTNYLPCR